MNYGRRLDETPGQRLRRRAAIAGLSAARLTEWLIDPENYPSAPVETRSDLGHLAAEERLSLSRQDGAAEPLLEAGKRHNVRLALAAFDGRVLHPERPLSFWRTLGPATAARGFRHGMELQAGCVVPAIGGGICLLSNGLFRIAAKLGWIILERHGHSTEAVPDHAAVWGLDATLFFPYVDLRVAPRTGQARLAVSIEGDELVIRVFSARPSPLRVELESEALLVPPGPEHMRASRIHRRIFNAEGQLLEHEVIAENRKRLLHDQAQKKRSCLSCGELSCHAKPSDSELLASRRLLEAA